MPLYRWKNVRVQLIYVIAVYIIIGSEPSFSFLASAIVILSIAQLFALGIIGKYLACVFGCSHGRPTYQVLYIVGGEKQ